ncbi:hypothetical protein MAPG_10505 [Magnaporthiopsis poae ATCC 64411]|uniref:Isotrichodermin C-15 hydroxylase n=1 Tax=Magnaporthiopsis poae (strain ATCC 64411 / 73-15) TaxID=644358 RepID=A0A0C4ECS0_MAGP6|nr:hypothetical protein MAPG_10505 [Magnaporthiopsis poae ATCC 64411]
MPAIDNVHLDSLLAPDGGRLAKLYSLGSILVTAYALYLLGLAIYRLWFHPLAKFPGPAWLAVSDLPFLFLGAYLGRFAARTLELHRRYGKVVRIGPNRLSVDGSVGWTDIYAHRPGGDATEFHKAPGTFASPDGRSLISADTRENHRRQRRALAHAFSEAALYEQESLIIHYVDLFIRRLSENADGGKNPIDMLSWLNYLTFDIIGDLSLGESFGSLESSSYHFWVRTILAGIKGVSRLRFFRHSGLGLLAAIDPDGAISALQRNTQYAHQKAEARIALGAEPLTLSTGEVDADGKPKMKVRRDFMSYMMRKVDTGESLAHDELLHNANTLIVAGSETTGTNLSTLFFELALLRNRAIRDAVTAEVRSQFPREADVTLRSVQANVLPLLHACLEESLRIHPPVSEMPPRISPGATVDGRYVPKGTIVAIYQNATCLNPEHFVDATSFRPERFLPPGHPMYDTRLAAGSNMAVFKPFSYGPRDCLGKNLAYAEMRLVAARILLRFDVELAEGTREDWLEDQLAFGIWEKNPLMLRLTERKDLELKGR